MAYMTHFHMIYWHKYWLQIYYSSSFGLCPMCNRYMKH